MNLDGLRARMNAAEQERLDALLAKAKAESAKYILGQVMGERVIVCLQCFSLSFNVNDIEHRYCGRCHAFHSFLEGQTADQPLQEGETK